MVPFIGWEWTQTSLDSNDHYGHKNIIIRGVKNEDIPQRPIAAGRQSDYYQFLNFMGGNSLALLSITVYYTILISIGVERPIKYQVSNLTDLAVSAGIDGVVASGWEVPTIKEKWKKIIAVVPGIRPKWEMKKKQILSDDQFRIMSPIEALKNGADYLVVGRPVMENKDPVKAVSLIKEEIKLWQN